MAAISEFEKRFTCEKMRGAQARRAVHLFESNRLRPYSPPIRRIIHAYALAAGIQKRVYPHLFRHQIITFLTKKGLISPKLQLLSGHAILSGAVRGKTSGIVSPRALSYSYLAVLASQHAKVELAMSSII